MSIFKIPQQILFPVILLACFAVLMLLQSKLLAPYHPIYGVNVEMSELLPSSSHYVTNNKGEDLIDIASRLGITLFRITNSTNTQNDSLYTKDEWDIVLNKMHKEGIKALILVESPTIYAKNIPSTYLPFVQDYVINSGVLSNPVVDGVDLYNEPAVNYQNIALLQKASRMIRAKSSTVKLTVGWWGVDTFQKDDNGNEIYKWDDYAAGKSFEPFIDFYSIHMYGFDEKKFGMYPDSYNLTQQFITKVKNGLQTKKPIFIEEFGAANGEAVSDKGTTGSPELQANAYSGVYQAINTMHDPQILGTAAFELYPRTDAPDPWTIIKDNGNYLFPAAYILQKFATKNPAW